MNHGLGASPHNSDSARRGGEGKRESKMWMLWPGQHDEKVKEKCMNIYMCGRQHLMRRRCIQVRKIEKTERKRNECGRKEKKKKTRRLED